MEWNLDEALAYYKRQGAPGDQNALIALLKEVQSNCGGRIPSQIPARIADAYAIKESILHMLIRRIPSLRLGDSHLLQICCGPNCSRQRNLVQCAFALEKEMGSFTVEFVPCMRMCGKGPNIKWDGQIHHNVNEERLRELIQNPGR